MRIYPRAIRFASTARALARVVSCADCSAATAARRASVTASGALCAWLCAWRSARQAIPGDKAEATAEAIRNVVGCAHAPGGIR